MSKIAFRERGSGSVLICLHGYAGNALQWDGVANQLENNFKVVIPNLSHLTMGKENITFSDQVELIATFIKTNYPNQIVSLAGISFGGSLTWALASRYPDLVDKVIFINPMPPDPKGSFALLYLKIFFEFTIKAPIIYIFLNSFIGKLFLKKVAFVFRNLQGEFENERVSNLQGRKLQFVAHLLYKFAWIINNERWSLWRYKLEFWTHDCLLIYDVRDPLFRESFYLKFSQTLACENVVQTQNAGHISIVQEPRLIAGAIREFLLRNTTMSPNNSDFAS